MSNSNQKGVIIKGVAVVMATFFVLSFSLAARCETGSEWTGNINGFFGFKYLDEVEWDPTDEQDEYGIEFDIGKKSWPVSIAVEYLSGSGDGEVFGIDFESDTSELNIGIKGIWGGYSNTRPFVGGGLSFLNAEFGDAVIKEEDDAVGIWISGGVYWILGEHFNLGIEGKFSTAEVELFGVEVDGGGGHIGALLGFHW